jgi:hypothetical protein
MGWSHNGDDPVEDAAGKIHLGEMTRSIPALISPYRSRVAPAHRYPTVSSLLLYGMNGMSARAGMIRMTDTMYRAT